MFNNQLIELQGTENSDVVSLNVINKGTSCNFTSVKLINR